MAPIIPDPAVPAQAFSDFEFCARLAQLRHGPAQVEPPHWPVRLAVERYLVAGVHQVLADGPDLACWEQPAAFLDEATERGYEHAVPLSAGADRNAYVLLRDYACWLEGALRLVDELEARESLWQPADPVKVEETRVIVPAWTEQVGKDLRGHVVRVAARSSPDAGPRWPELLLGLDPRVEAVHVHRFLLPAPSKDRVPSPLCLAYAHPLTGKMRLATLGTERFKFTDAWRRIARWETENCGDVATIAWPEWREGIERDRCIDKCYEMHTYVPGDGDRYGVARDAAQALAALARPELAVRKRELCPRCYMRGWCHPSSDRERGSYLVTKNSEPRTPRAAS